MGKSVRFAPPHVYQPESGHVGLGGHVTRFSTPVYPVRDISGYLRHSDSFRYVLFSME